MTFSVTVIPLVAAKIFELLWKIVLLITYYCTLTVFYQKIISLSFLVLEKF